MNIFLETSWWLLPLLVGVAIVLSYILYGKSKKSYPVPIFQLLFLLRTLSIAILLFLLLNPFISIKSQKILPPIIALVHDNSQSITMHSDSAYYSTEYASHIQKLKEDLERNKFTVHEFTFGDSLRIGSAVSYTEQLTNISAALSALSAQYRNSNLGATILCTDGIFNSGENPLYNADYQSYIPIYTVALGNPNQTTDNSITAVKHNELVFTNSPFEVYMQVESYNFTHTPSYIKIFEGNSLVYQTSITPQLAEYATTIACKLTTRAIGNVRYKVVIEPHSEELTHANNSYEFTVHSVDNTQKILLLYAAPHPDVAAIKRAVQSNKMYDIAVLPIHNAPKNLHEYACVVVHGLSGAAPASIATIETIMQAKRPVFYISTDAKSPSSAILSKVVGLAIESQHLTNEAHAKAYRNNSVFSLSDEFVEFIESAPPLIVPYGNYVVNASSQVVLNQAISTVAIDAPLLLFNETDNIKQAAIIGDGLWRWRMYAYRKYKDFYLFDSFINKCINYIMLTHTKDMLHVSLQSIYKEHETIECTAELFNKNYERVPNQNISLHIKNSKQEILEYTLRANADAYSLHIGKLPPDSYTYKASTIVDNQEYTAQGEFIVEPIQIELLHTRANHSLLAELSRNTGAAMVAKEDILSLADSIKQNSRIVPLSHTIKTQAPLHDYILLLIVLMCLLSAEWFLRKYHGGY